MIAEFYGFFFSSRRRHTRSKRDWSSDVCSSDLGEQLTNGKFRITYNPDQLKLAGHKDGNLGEKAMFVRNDCLEGNKKEGEIVVKIGRASCRERVRSSGGDEGVEETWGEEIRRID